MALCYPLKPYRVGLLMYEILIHFFKLHFLDAIQTQSYYYIIYQVYKTVQDKYLRYSFRFLYFLMKKEPL